MRHRYDDGNDGAPALWVELVVADEVCVLRMGGELGGTSLAALEAQTEQLRSAPCRHVIVDVAGLAAVDGLGTDALVTLQANVQARGGAMTVTGASGGVEMALESTPLDLDVVGSVPPA